MVVKTFNGVQNKQTKYSGQNSDFYILFEELCAWVFLYDRGWRRRASWAAGSGSLVLELETDGAAGAGAGLETDGAAGAGAGGRELLYQKSFKGWRRTGGELLWMEK
ncbi:Hypothetical predicted protein [Olea europaea subsp. europaea]|uniref:Uncharacterized protein n=1 Tax=Olea europaea subsp. europaea TaxID=158383 RepID=A0A8S0S0K8_OLEEU|nr:Hypothetical predicted protein [Olea europaea subsp. europaea]